MAASIARPSGVLRVRAWLPQGGLLPEGAWEVRHRWVVRIVWAHAAVIAGLALLWQYGLVHAVLEASIVAVAGLLAGRPYLARRIRSVAASFGLLSSSAILVHLSGGYIEMHFHFFVMIILISLYQDWTPFLIAIAYVVVHHGVFGALAPASVYNHPDAIANPWKWALIHGSFILAASATSLVSWRLSEDQLLSRVLLERRAREAAEEGLRLREEFLSVATHELRTPVTSIKGYAQLSLKAARAEGDGGGERLHGMLHRLDEQCDRLARLVTQLLDVSRLQSRRLEIARVPTDVREIVQRAVDTAKQQTDRHRWDVVLVNMPRADLDADRIEQIVTNLLDNAIRYSPNGGTIRVNLSSANGLIRLAVSDEGIGIAPEHLGHIFDRFYQAHRGQHLGGMGLGLYISREIAVAHGGDVAVEPQERGTRFVVTLPVGPASAARAPARPSPLPPSKDAVRTPQPARILVVEDEGPIRSILAAALADTGASVVTAADGAAALRVVEAERPDVIVLDKMMPGIDGSGFVAAYGELTEDRAPIIALCASRDAEEWARSIGAFAWIAKPFDVDTVLREVGRALESTASIHSTR